MTPHLRKPPGGGASQLDSPAASAAEAAAGGQYAETVELAGDAREGSGSSAGTGLHSESEPIIEHEAESKADASGQMRAEAPLSQSDPKPVAGEVRADGLVYSVNPDGESVSLVGWYGAAFEGDVAVPSEISSGEYSYAVTQVGALDADGCVPSVFEGASPTSVSVPGSVETMLEGALSGCSSLARISVSPKNETFASFDGMLFTKDLTSLLLVPAGKEGAALLPDPADTVPAGAFSRCSRLPAVRVGEGSAAFSSRDGILYTKDMKTLVACPPGAGGAVVVPASVEAIADGAFAGCAVASITVLGDVREIAEGAFEERARAEAVVALPGGEGYEARRAAWEAAGFSRFAEPARPGDVSAPEAPGGEGGSDAEGAVEASGLAYEVLDDYTLAASWAGPEGPAGEIEIPATAEVGGVSYRVSAVAAAGFAGCSGLTGVELPAGLTRVGERAFEACGLAELWLPASVASVGSRALAACPSLGRVVALGATEAAPDALAECSGVSVYCPAGSEGSWNMGLPAAGNHLMPYDVSLAEDPLQLEAGQSASLLDGGSLLAPEPVEASYSYAAKPLSVDADGVATGKAEGSSEVSVALTLDAVELARATRAVEVAAAPESGPMPELGADSAASNEPSPENAVAEDDTTFATEIQPRMTASGVSILSGSVSLESLNEVFDYEYQGANLRYQITKEPSGDTPGTCTVLGRSYSVPSLRGVDLVIPDIAIDAANGNAAYSVTATGAYAFTGAGIVSLKLPQTLKTITGDAFGQNYDLEEVLIPKSVTNMGFNPFEACSALTKIEVEEGNPSYTAKDGVLYSKDMTMLIGGTPATIKGRFLIPETVKTVRVNSIAVCDGLTYLYIPKSVTNFGQGYNIIGSLPNLEEIDIDPENASYAVSDGLLYKKENGVSTVLIGGTPKSTPDVPVIPGTVTAIDKSAFSRRTNITSMVLPPAIAKVSANAFNECANLHHVSILSQAQVVFDTNVFGQCRGLGEVLIATPSPSFKNTEGSALHNLFNGVDASRVTLHCPTDAVDFWESYGLNVIPFSTGVPAIIGLPATQTDLESRFESSIPDDSAFAHNVTLVHEFDPGASGITADLSDLTGRTVAFSSASVASGGSATLSSKLVYNDGANNNIVLAESTSMVQVAPTSGPLPTAADPLNKDETKASWTLSDDGTLTIESTEEVGDFGWTPDDPKMSGEYWGALRDRVTKVDTRGIAGASSMACWFMGMERLTDIVHLKIPEGAKDLTSLLQGCGVSEIPEGFELPSSVTSVRALLSENPIATVPERFAASLARNAIIFDCSYLFQGTDLETLPVGFSLPSHVRDATAAFGYCKIETLPEGFALPDSLEVIDAMFKSCTRLAYLPEHFTLPASLSSASELFDGCLSLACLPERFTLPVSFTDAGKAGKMFGNCVKLNELPAAFHVPDGFDLAAAPDMFYSYSLEQELNYAGDDEAVRGATEGYWTDQHRVLVASGEGSLEFRLSARDGSRFEVWTSKMPGPANGMTGEPAVPLRDDQVFALWYADEACTVRFDFSKRVDEQLEKTDGRYVVYGTYLAGTRQGALPTVGNSGSAFWSLSDDGGLYLRGNGKVSDLGWAYDGSEAFPTSGFWGPYRDIVKKASMSPTFRADSMAYWFAGMHSLADTSEVFVPNGTEDVSSLFDMRGWNDGTSAFTRLPDGFTLPNGVVKALDMFQNCAIEELPSEFSLPETLVSMDSMFAHNRNLKAVPDGVKLNPNVIGTRWMFCDCASLTSLPAGFNFCGSAPDSTYMFKDCINLKTLPDGFVLSEGGKKLGMFENCPSLSYLPDGFTLPKTIVNETKPFYCDIAEGEPRVATYYAGSDPVVLGYDWESQNRTLITDPADRDLFTVTYKVMGEDGAWKTYATAVTDSAGFASDLNAPQNGGYGFAGWCTDESCLDEFAFDTPLDKDATLYGKWILAGGKNVDQGRLPTVLADGSTGLDGWWRLDGDGTLNIRCDNPDASLASLGWEKNEADLYEGWWGDYRSLVKSVRMQNDMKAVDMENWFSGMNNLVDARGVFITENALKVNGLFRGCTALEDVADDLVIPDDVASTAEMFFDCGSLKRLPVTLAIPRNAVDVSNMFRDMRVLEVVPASVRLADASHLVNADRFVQGCWALTTLPESLSIPESVETAYCFADDCVGLVSLSEGFSLPVNGGSLKSVYRMFYNCGSLTSLPTSFKLSGLSSDVETAQMFFVKPGDPNKPGDPVFSLPVVTYYSGNAADITLSDTFWKDSNRELVTGEVPSGRTLVGFKLPDASGSYGDVWTKVMTDDAGMLVAPAAPTSENAVFVGWYTNADCTTAFDFEKSVADQLGEPCVLYARYQEMGGKLPTVGADGQPGEDASWELSHDGTLTIGCDVEGAKITQLWATTDSIGVNGVPSEGYWTKLRDKVVKVVMEPGIELAPLPGASAGSGEPSTASMRFWFKGMTNLVDVSEVYIPDGTEELLHTFAMCSSLTSIPSSLRSFPESVRDMGGMFRNTGIESIPEDFILPKNVEVLTALFTKVPIKSVPAGFVLPDSVTDARLLFENCADLEFLPDEFKLPPHVWNLESMFVNCEKLRALPCGFTIPGEATDVRNMFYGCTSLATLPEGFAFENPGNIEYASGMFACDTSLVALPSSLDLTGLAKANGVGTMFLNPTALPLETYCPGGVQRLLPPSVGDDASAYWLNSYRRNLVVDPPTGRHAVTFVTKVAGSDAPTTYHTVLADASGKVPDPGAPSKFGYAFSGWCTDAACENPFDFELDTVTQDTTLYGIYRMIAKIDVPLFAKATIDSTGSTTPASLKFTSFAPVPMKVTSVAGELAGGASRLFPKAGDAEVVELAVTVGRNSVSIIPGSKDAEYRSGGLAGSIKAAVPSGPSVLDGSIGLNLNGAQIDYQPGDDITSFAKLTWTVEVLP